MKMNSAQIEQTLRQLNAEERNAQAIPAEHPAMSRLEELFGNHTYFLDGNGLNIVEPVEPSDADSGAGVVVNIAHWADASASSLQPHEPKSTDQVVDLTIDRHH